MCAQPSARTASPLGGGDSTSRTFAVDAGRDLFFTGMNEELAIELMESPLGTLDAPEDRYIAAERLKFFPTVASARALMDFIRRFENAPDNLPVEERAARRKAVESLGRHAGAHLLDEVRDFLAGLLTDEDARENAVWALSQMKGTDVIGDKIADMLADEGAPHRVVLHAITTLRVKGAVETVRAFESSDPAACSAAAAALAVLGGDVSRIKDVPEMLRSGDINVRRAAVHDLAAARYTPALGAIARAPLSLVLRMRAARAVLRDDEMSIEVARVMDEMFWDHPNGLDLLGRVRETKRQRDPARNVKALYRNDALDAYVACRTLCEDGAEEAGELALRSYTERTYFDYFGSYHCFKTLGWLRYMPAYSVLEEAARTLPPRFFNHRIGAILALANLGNGEAIEVVKEAVKEKGALWQVKYACLMAAEMLGDEDVRRMLKDDDDWVIRSRARLDNGFEDVKNMKF